MPGIQIAGNDKNMQDRMLNARDLTGVDKDGTDPIPVNTGQAIPHDARHLYVIVE